MRKIIIFLFLILIPLVFASKTETTSILNINDTTTVYGKTLTVLSASSAGKLKVSVDGIEGIVKPGVNRTTNINEMFIEILNFTYIDEEYVETILEITVNFECGDDACNLSENSVICCTDCGCEGNLKCIDNVCMKEDCVINFDCDDNITCTLDECSGSPNTCSNTEITECINDDGCCLDTCDQGNDNDCIIEEVVEEEEEIIEEEPEVKEAEEVIEAEEAEKEVIVTEKEKGILIIIGIALLVVIIGFFIFARRY